MGRLGGVAPAAATETALYTPPAQQKAMLKVTVNNQNGVDATVRIVHRLGAGPTVLADRLATQLIPAGANRHSTYFEVNAPQEVLVETSIGNVVFQAKGVEEPI